jgi:hypothetical protein
MGGRGPRLCGRRAKAFDFAAALQADFLAHPDHAPLSMGLRQRILPVNNTWLQFATPLTTPVRHVISGSPRFSFPTLVMPTLLRVMRLHSETNQGSPEDDTLRSSKLTFFFD